ncbi:MAG: acyl-CoA dehydrogenase family protein, partial [Hyphomicrobiales bacterium]
MRATLPTPDISRILRQIELSYRIDDVRKARKSWAAATNDTCAAILESAAQFAREMLEPLNQSMDATGCVLIDGRVHTAPRHRDAWAQTIAAGWPTLEAPEQFGGQGLPAVLTFAVQEQFDRACPAFGMLPVPQRSAFRLISAFGDERMKSDWLPRLATGEWAATICVSEVGAGSDLPRIRTKAEQAVDGTWRITGEKCWISFGDHDLTDQIGHVVLAQTTDAEGRRRPSLFLVPALLADASRNSIHVRRIEHKLGLHGSPTCALGFDEATGHLLGEVGRGLPQMFVMIANMRLAVGAMGLGIASSCGSLALAYARERKQGGRPSPLPIDHHADVQLQLLDILAPVELLRGLLFAVANCNDLAATGDRTAEALAAWLLPIVKTSGGEVAFEAASGAIQVLGGAGYTAEWPLEQALRDARVLTIFEGTTGIQSLDLVHRRLLDDDTGYSAFLLEARRLGEPRLAACIDELESAAQWLRAHPSAADAGATAFLHLAANAAFSWIAAGYVDARITGQVLGVAAEHWLDTAPARAVFLHSTISTGVDRA